MKLRVLNIIAACAFFALGSVAAFAEAVDKSVEEQLRKALELKALNLKIESIEASEVPGLLAVKFQNGPLAYATEKGDYFIVGDLFSVSGDQIVNITESKRDDVRRQQLAAVDLKDMIIFPAEGETRTHINVFTDVTCFYCQKLHLEVPELNKQGVEVRYLAYPRAGINSDGYKKLATAWCSDNPQKTLTDLKAKKAVAEKVCDDNPISEQFKLGQVVGVRGTPAVVTAEGRLMPGYMPAADLIATLGLK